MNIIYNILLLFDIKASVKSEFLRILLRFFFPYSLVWRRFDSRHVEVHTTHVIRHNPLVMCVNYDIVDTAKQCSVRFLRQTRTINV